MIFKALNILLEAEAIKDVPIEEVNKAYGTKYTKKQAKHEGVALQVAYLYLAWKIKNRKRTSVTQLCTIWRNR